MSKWIQYWIRDPEKALIGTESDTETQCPCLARPVRIRAHVCRDRIRDHGHCQFALNPQWVVFKSGAFALLVTTSMQCTTFMFQPSTVEPGYKRTVYKRRKCNHPIFDTVLKKAAFKRKQVQLRSCKMTPTSNVMLCALQGNIIWVRFLRRSIHAHCGWIERRRNLCALHMKGEIKPKWVNDIKETAKT